MVPEEENDGLLDAERHQARHTIAPRAQLFPVAEKFVSVNGEGLAAGRPAAFIRFAECHQPIAYRYIALRQRVVIALQTIFCI